MDQVNMNISLDELKQRWAGLDQKLDRLIRLNPQLLTSRNRQPARSAMQWLTASLVLEAFFTLAAIVLLGSFIADHFSAAKFTLPAAALDILGIALLQNLIRQIVAARQIDYAQPIVAIQKALARLRMLRVRCTQVALLVAVLAWPPLLIVSLKAFFGLDAYSVFGSAYLWANVLFGLAIIPLALWLSRKFAGRMSGSPLAQYLARTVSGRSINAANDFLAELSEFESEHPAP